MARQTPATLALARTGLAFTVHAYAYDPGAGSIGLHAADALGEPPACVLKTLMAEVDGKPVCAVLASDHSLAMKRLAAAAGGKSAAMMPPAKAERLTGYKVGGISPLGQRHAVPTFLDSAAIEQPYVFVNGGQRGLQIRLAPADLVVAIGANVAALTA
jgi:Cys-tRNA(Pro)/Cys-tRNA(Cys) deacylase